MATISNTAEQATEHVKEAASHARTTLLDFSTQVMKLINNAREAEGRGVEAVLDRMGLQRRTSPLRPIAWFVAGAAVAGAAVALMTPSTGKALRELIASFLKQEADAVTKQAVALEHRAEEAFGHRPNGMKQEGA